MKCASLSGDLSYSMTHIHSQSYSMEEVGLKKLTTYLCWCCSLATLEIKQESIFYPQYIVKLLTTHKI